MLAIFRITQAKNALIPAFIIFTSNNMTKDQQNYNIQEIFFSCTETKAAVREHFIPVHGLSHIYSGEITVIEGDNRYTFREGETILFRRNHLAKFMKQPVGTVPFKSVSIFFTQEFLQNYYTKLPDPSALVKSHYKGPLKTIRFGKNPLLESLFSSVLPYYEFSGPLPQTLIDIKLAESMTILRTIDKEIDQILSDFAEPGKIDLADFMQKNYSFNVSMERFGYLTGRSLASFKRDFQKAFNSPPQKWLLEKRLTQAHYLITEKKQKTSEVYLEVGFENLSHFSVSFKKMFGYNPSSL
ncbi:helix-turn-helix domain-containing protein [Mucilaginibacter ginsenosidivorax]|uniref:Helix-turn-helix transcriptional regulator n=1 Tax=Mucilaginibacter ginsenosidivorax TaxID=862126 RepID=A0A5B8W524_9SPHI|nr:AraC family transcriptional regulator [Mucilaginibacter ginsenosidivorax]QEC78527.1 helix-turn-helix transcriptional regulator [Mucilaginibacter ginsenosidivorax]